MMTIHRKMETTITTQVNLTALTIITLSLHTAGLLTGVATLVAVIEETFQTRAPIGDFQALVLIHITMDLHNAARGDISTTYNGPHRDHGAVGDNIALARQTVMGHKLLIDHTPLTMTYNPPELAKVIIMAGPPVEMKRSTRHNPNPLAEMPSSCRPRPTSPMKPRPQTRAGNSALLSSQRLHLPPLQSQYLTLPRGCSRSAIRPLAHQSLPNNLAIGLPMGRCPNSNQIRGVIAVTGTVVDGIEIETAEISASRENSVIHGIAEMTVASINVVIDDKEIGPQIGPRTGQIAAVNFPRNRLESHHRPKRSGFLLALNHALRSLRSSLMLNLCTTESRAMSL